MAVPSPSSSQLRDFGALRAAQVRDLDTAAVALGVSMLQLMEVAGAQVARHAWNMLGEKPGAVHVVAASGNNGGDGLVAARHLDAWGCPVRVTLVAEEERCGPAVAAQVAILRACGPAIEVIPDGGIRTVDELIIDALLGIGISGAPRPGVARAIDRMAGTQTLSVDIPSGLDADSGNAAGAVVTASSTVTLTAMKAGLWAEPGRQRAGRIVIAGVGIPTAAWRECGLSAPLAIRGGGLLPISTDTP